MSRLNMSAREITNKRELKVYYLYSNRLKKDENNLKKINSLDRSTQKTNTKGRTK